MYNRIVLVGNLTRDIELRYSNGGLAIGKSAIATSRKYKGNDGTQNEDVCFVDITFFGRSAEVANQYLKKGSKVLVEGRLQFEQWSDQSGQKRSKHSVSVENMQMLGSRGENSSDSYGQNSYSNDDRPNSYEQKEIAKPQNQVARETQKESIPEIDIDDDEIPF